MKRVKICLAILSFLVSVSIFSGFWVNKRCGEIIEYISIIEDDLDQGNREHAAYLAKEMDKKWSDFRQKALILLNSEKLTEINNISLRIVYLINEESDEASAELAELRDLTEHLKKSEIPLITSIF